MLFLFFSNYTATTYIYTLSLHDALPISYFGELLLIDDGFNATYLSMVNALTVLQKGFSGKRKIALRSEEHTSELQSRGHLVCRLLLEKKKTNKTKTYNYIKKYKEKVNCK